MNILTNVNQAASAVTLWSAKMDDLETLLLRVREINGSTITVESCADNSSWAAVPYGQQVTGGTVVDNTTGTITAVGTYVFPVNAAYVRVRVSTYVGPGNVTIEAEGSAALQNTVLRQFETAITAQGTNQATARPIQAMFTRIGTAAASTGVILPENLPTLSEVVIRNGGANAVNVFPPVGKSINGGTVNASLSLGVNASARYVCDSSGNYWSF